MGLGSCVQAAAGCASQPLLPSRGGAHRPAGPLLPAAITEALRVAEAPWVMGLSSVLQS